jgi:hypothetical protein
MRGGQRGVSLLLVLVMLVLLIGFMASYTLTRTATFLDDQTATVARLKKAGDALDAYAAAAKRLPCPANPATDTGEEVTLTASTCTYPEGTLPWKTIGLGRADGYDEWGFKLSYRVYINGGDGSLTQPRGVDMSHCDSEQITSDPLAAGRLCTESADPYAHNQSAALFVTNKGLRLIDNGIDLSNRAYAVISHGQTALGAYTASGSRMELPLGDERNNAGSGPFVSKAFSDPDTPATAAQHFDDLLVFRTVEDVAKRAGLAARDWPERAVRFDSANVAAAVGNNNANTGRNSFTINGLTVTASSGNVSISSAGGTSGIGVVDSGTDYPLALGEYLRFDLPQNSSKVFMVLSGFGHFDLLGTRYREQVTLRFYTGSTQVGTAYVRQACNSGIDGLATLTLQAPTVGSTFNRIEMEPAILSPNLFGLSSSFLVAEAAACGPTHTTSCQASLATVANSCLSPSITGTAFAPASISQGSSSQLSFTISNGTDNTSHSGMGFNAVLPANMTIASPASPSTTCASASVTATPGTTSFGVTDLSLASGVASCTVSLRVTTAVTGSFATTSGMVTGTANLLVSPSFTGATLTVVP